VPVVGDNRTQNEPKDDPPNRAAVAIVDRETPNLTPPHSPFVISSESGFSTSNGSACDCKELLKPRSLNTPVISRQSKLRSRGLNRSRESNRHRPVNTIVVNTITQNIISRQSVRTPHKFGTGGGRKKKRNRSMGKRPKSPPGLQTWGRKTSLRFLRAALDRTTDFRRRQKGLRNAVRLTPRDLNPRVLKLGSSWVYQGRLVRWRRWRCGFRDRWVPGPGGSGEVR